jgi:hypothetical protein
MNTHQIQIHAVACAATTECSPACLSPLLPEAASKGQHRHHLRAAAAAAAHAAALHAAELSGKHLYSHCLLPACRVLWLLQLRLLLLLQQLHCQGPALHHHLTSHLRENDVTRNHTNDTTYMLGKCMGANMCTTLWIYPWRCEQGRLLHTTDTYCNTHLQQYAQPACIPVL